MVHKCMSSTLNKSLQILCFKGRDAIKNTRRDNFPFLLHTIPFGLSGSSLSGEVPWATLGCLETTGGVVVPLICGWMPYSGFGC